jgi:signal transduction histidine kinase
MNEVQTAMRHLLHQVPGWLWTTDRELRLTLVGGADAIRTIIHTEPLIGQSIYDLHAGVTVTRVFGGVGDHVQAHLRALEGHTSVYECHLPDQGIWLEIAIYPLYDADGAIIGCVGAGQDVTQRKHVEQIMQQQEEALDRHRAELEQRVIERTQALQIANQQLRQEIEERIQAEDRARSERVVAQALYEVALTLNSSLRLDEVLDRILNALERVIPHDGANLFLIDGDHVRIAKYHRYNHGVGEEWIAQQRLRIADYPTFSWMLNNPDPLRIPDVHTSPWWVHLPEAAWIRSYVGVRICLDDKVLGFLNLDSAHVGFFTDQHAEMLRAFAAQAAMALNNAQLHQRAQEIAAYEERQKLARELHDAVSQTLLSANMIADSLPRMIKRDPDRADAGFAYLQRLIRGALAELRALLMELRPAALLQADLNVLIQQLAEAVTSRKEIEIDLKLEREYALPANVKVALYRVTQEALNNIVKHSRARHVSISLRKIEAGEGIEGIEVIVADDGRGFDPRGVTSDHMGLTIMRERANEIGARLTLDSGVGRGTRIAVRWLNSMAAAHNT